MLFMLLLLTSKVSAEILKCPKDQNEIICIKDYENYTSFNPPQPWPREVGMHFEMKDLIRVDYEEQTLSLSFIIELLWEDPRVTILNKTSGTDWYLLSLNSLDKIWTPEIYFSNSFDVRELKSLGKLESSKALWYNHPGNLYFSQALEANFKCNFDHKNFPFDQHECIFEMRCWVGATHKLKLKQPKLFDSLDPTQNPLKSVER